MSTIDISKNYRQYSPQQLRDYAYNGIVSCGSFDLTDFLEYFLQGYLDDSMIDEIKKEAYENGYDAGMEDNSVDYELPDEVIDRIQKAIKILEDI